MMLTRNRKRSIAYVDCRPPALEWRDRPPSQTISTLTLVARALRTWREDARTAVQLYFVNRTTPGDAMAAYLTMATVVVVVLVIAFGVHLVARMAS